MSRRLLATFGLIVIALACPAVAAADPDPLYRFGFEGSEGGLQYFNGSASGAPGVIGSAAHFDGVDDYAAVALDDLHGQGGVAYDALTVEFWLKWDQYADDDRLALELSENAGVNAGTFVVNPNDHRGAFFVSSQDSVDDWNDNSFARPSAGEWHHYAIVITRNLPSPYHDTVRVWVDGVEQAHAGAASRFNHEYADNKTLYLMSRAGTGLFGAGSIDELAIYAQALTAEEILAHAQAQPETTITAGPSGDATAATFGFASDDPGATFECRIDDGPFEPCTSPKQYPSLGLGAHSFEVRAISQLGRTDATPASRSFVLVAPPAPTAPAAVATTAGDAGPRAASLAGLRLPLRAGSAKALAAALRRCAAKRGQARRAACRREAKAKLLPTISFTLDRPARVSFSLRRWATGRTTSFEVDGTAGRNRVRWRPRIAGKDLLAGTYTLSVKLGEGSNLRVVESLTVKVR